MIPLEFRCRFCRFFSSVVSSGFYWFVYLRFEVVVFFCAMISTSSS
jgi:hypothetical protein